MRSAEEGNIRRGFRGEGLLQEGLLGIPSPLPRSSQRLDEFPRTGKTKGFKRESGILAPLLGAAGEYTIVAAD